MKLHHHTLVVRDIDEALKLFCDHLGMKLVTRAAGTGDVLEIAFVEEQQTGHRIELYKREKDFGKLDHIAYQVDDVDKTFEALKQKAGLMVDREPYDIEQFRARAAFLRDKNGFRIQLVQFL